MKNMLASMILGFGLAACGAPMEATDDELEGIGESQEAITQTWIGKCETTSAGVETGYCIKSAVPQCVIAEADDGCVAGEGGHPGTASTCAGKKKDTRTCHGTTY